MCLIPESWQGGHGEQLIWDDIRKEDGSEWEHGDRRQEIVFIGHGMKRDNIQELFDKCLLTDEEMLLGPEKWKETMEHLDEINLTLEIVECDEGGEEEEEEVEEDSEVITEESKLNSSEPEESEEPKIKRIRTE